MRGERLTAVPLLLVSVGLLLAGCTERTASPVGAGRLPPPKLGFGPFDDTLVVATADVGLADISLGSGPTLSLGESKGVTARALLRFTRFPADVDSVLSATARLVVRRKVGAAPLPLVARRLVAPWEETEATWEARENSDGVAIPWIVPGGDLDTGAAGVGMIATEGETLGLVGLQPGLVQQWADTSEGNDGIALLAPVPGTLAEFASRQALRGVSSRGPVLQIVFQHDSEVDTADILVENDVTLALFEGPPPDPNLRVGSVPPYRTFLRFDLSFLPHVATVNYAELLVPVVSTETLAESLVVEAFSAAEGWTGAGTLVEVNPSGRGVVGDSSTTLTIPLSGLVSGWVTGEVVNRGIVLRAFPEGGAIQFMDLASGASGGEGPRLRVVYTLPPEPPFPLRRPSPRDIPARDR